MIKNVKKILLSGQKKCMHSGELLGTFLELFWKTFSSFFKLYDRHHSQIRVYQEMIFFLFLFILSWILYTFFFKNAVLPGVKNLWMGSFLHFWLKKSVKYFSDFIHNTGKISSFFLLINYQLKTKIVHKNLTWTKKRI